MLPAIAAPASPPTAASMTERRSSISIPERMHVEVSSLRGAAASISPVKNMRVTVSSSRQLRKCVCSRGGQLRRGEELQQPVCPGHFEMQATSESDSSLAIASRSSKLSGTSPPDPATLFSGCTVGALAAVGSGAVVSVGSGVGLGAIVAVAVGNGVAVNVPPVTERW